MARKGQAWAGSRHSDKVKFCNDLNGPKTPKMSERLFENIAKSGDFQAEYEGSIPFTRSKCFQALLGFANFHSGNVHFLAACLAPAV
jgi:hypothetical protein